MGRRVSALVSCLGATLMLGVTAVPVQAANVFSNPAPITIPTQGPFSPYPSTINVTGLSGTITDINVTLYGYVHAWPDDVDVVLIGPSGTSYTVLMADAGHRKLPTAVDLTFDDSAASQILNNDGLVSGSYRPADWESYDLDPTLTNTSLSVFNGKTPNGTWSLYGGDDTANGGGSIGGGWSLDIATNAISVTSFTPSEGMVGDTVTVTGKGFEGTTAVKFGGTPAATFTAGSSTQITATVPAGAGTGPITVVGPGGTSLSASDFVVDHKRDVSLVLSGNRAKGRVSVDDGYADCRSGIPVIIQRQRGGKWKTVAAVLTNGKGNYSAPGASKNGRYRSVAKLKALVSGDVCLRKTSPKVST
ncbi:MAG: IPT/TIG domain-containing protein [Actinomycetota bacterium]